MGISADDVKYVAQLSRLEFKEDEIEKFTKDLSSIVGYVNKLNELDTEDVEALVNPIYIENDFREDDIKDSLDRENVLLNAPEKEEGYFKVPTVIEG
jgi:aspartyl-tRNA(Asn)/glutamyl-tRNA(Gln) amidotransferase subunit C